MARHPNRPGFESFLGLIFEGFVEVHGDRRFADDHAIMTGFAEYKGQPVLVVGHVKGVDTKEKIFRNFGYARPEGYRKALRTMRLAEKFSRPIIVFIDTPAAYPGIESEERGVAEAIAVNLREMMLLDTPIVIIVSGEGGSGGALGIAVGDRVLMQEFAIYSVIPPEGCAAILWRDANKKVEAAAALKLTAPDLLKAGIIDHIIPEPIGGAHTDPAAAAALVTAVLDEVLAEISALDFSDHIARDWSSTIRRRNPTRAALKERDVVSKKLLRCTSCLRPTTLRSPSCVCAASRSRRAGSSGTSFSSRSTAFTRCSVRTLRRRARRRPRR